MNKSTGGQGSGKANIIKATYDLQRKVGKGPIDEAVIKKSQQMIDTNDVDFGPVALAILQRLNATIEEAKNPGRSFDDLKQLFIQPVMELKANASTFHYDLVGALANVMLGFLESIKIMDKDAIEIVRAHHDSLHAIIIHKVSGNGGARGQTLVLELKNACDRYYNKQFGK